MYLNDYAARIEAAETYARYVAQSDNYRKIVNARRSAAADAGSAEARQNVLDRVGAALIALGRRLCERGGTVQVAVEFRVAPARPRGGRHVA